MICDGKMHGAFGWWLGNKEKKEDYLLLLVYILDTYLDLLPKIPRIIFLYGDWNYYCQSKILKVFILKIFQCNIIMTCENIKAYIYT